jgi:hypothetical protein
VSPPEVGEIALSPAGNGKSTTAQPAFEGVVGTLGDGQDRCCNLGDGGEETFVAPTQLERRSFSLAWFAPTDPRPERHPCADDAE